MEFGSERLTARTCAMSVTDSEMVQYAYMIRDDQVNYVVIGEPRRLGQVHVHSYMDTATVNRADITFILT